MDLVRVVAELLLGLVVGVLAGLLGVGGGVLLVPALVYLLSVDQHSAQGVSLLVIVPTAVFGAVAHHRRGNVDLRLALLLGVAAVGGSLAGAWLSGLLPAEWLRRGFGAFLVTVAGSSLLAELRARR